MDPQNYTYVVTYLNDVGVCDNTEHQHQVQLNEVDKVNEIENQEEVPFFNDVNLVGYRDTIVVRLDIFGL